MDLSYPILIYVNYIFITYTIPDKFDIQIIADVDQDKFSIEQVEALFYALDHEVEEWSSSGHPDIFKYKIAAIGPGGVAEFDENSDDQMIMCTIVYHEEVVSMVFGVTQNILNTVSPDFRVTLAKRLFEFVAIHD